MTHSTSRGAAACPPPPNPPPADPPGPSQNPYSPTIMLVWK